MIEEIKEYKKSERFDLYEAARTWRLPYWDWAMKKPLPEDSQKRDYDVPLVVLTKEVSIRLPGIPGYGQYPNAFYQFTMPRGIAMDDESLENTDPLKDLRITPSAEKYTPKGQKVSCDVIIRVSYLPALSLLYELLTFLSSANARQRVDTQKSQESPRPE